VTKSEIIDKIYDQLDKISHARYKLSVELQNLSGMTWKLEHWVLSIENVEEYRQFAHAAELAAADEQDAVELLVGYYDDLQEELYNPTCEICGQKETVRFAIDDEGPHKCEGE